MTQNKNPFQNKFATFADGAVFVCAVMLLLV
jgi:hypothetical protein